MMRGVRLSSPGAASHDAAAETSIARADRPAGIAESQRRPRDDLERRCHDELRGGWTRQPVPPSPDRTTEAPTGCDAKAAGCPCRSRLARPSLGQDDSGDEPEIAGIAGFMGLGAIIGGPSNLKPGSITDPARTETTTCPTWAVRRVRLPMLALALPSSFRVPRFSRLGLADSVRFVRFNMARPSLPPVWRVGDAQAAVRRRARPPRSGIGAAGAIRGPRPSH